MVLKTTNMERSQKTSDFINKSITVFRPINELEKN